jgi:hypothetical protein
MNFWQNAITLYISWREGDSMTGILQLLDMLTVKIKLVETVKHMQLTRRTAIKPTKKNKKFKNGLCNY